MDSDEEYMSTMSSDDELMNDDSADALSNDDGKYQVPHSSSRPSLCRRPRCDITISFTDSTLPVQTSTTTNSMNPIPISACQARISSRPRGRLTLFRSRSTSLTISSDNKMT
jgi:hypothetical protein